MKRRKFKKLMKREAAQAPDNLSYRSVALRAASPESIDEDNRSVEIIIASQEPTEVFDFDRYEVVKEVLLIAGAEYPKNRQIPLLDVHKRFDTTNVLGSIRGLKKEGDLLIGRAHFSGVADVEDTWQKVREGHLTDFSAGYRPIDSQWIPEGETMNVGGRSFEGPVRITKRWRIREGSIVPIGADELSKARAATTNQPKPNEGGHMNKKTRKFLVSRGMNPEATDDEAWAFMETLDVRAEPEPEPKPKPAANDDPPPDVDAIRAAATGDERNRIREIDALGRRWDNPTLADELIASEATADDAYRKFEAYIDAQREDNFSHYQPATVTADAQDRFRGAATDALLIRSPYPGSRPETPAEGSGDLTGFSLKELAREALRVGGHSTAGNMMEMVGRALSTSDLPLILANVANKSLFAGWDTAPETWRAWVGTGSVSDFKTHSMPRASEISDLEEVPESGEYRHGKITEAQEQYSIAKYGKLFAITRETIINDDLGALTRIPAMHGEAASRKIADVIYAVLTANAAMGDGTALFHADHGNFVDNGSGAAPGSATIGAMILAMKMQQDLQGLRRLNIRPEFVIMPVALEAASEIFFQTLQWSDHSTVATDSTFASTRKNLYAGDYFTRVYEPRLDDDDAAAWYGAARKGMTVNAFFLNGVEMPYLEQREGWSVDGTEYKVRIEVGAKAVDWKGLYFNDGN